MHCTALVSTGLVAQQFSLIQSAFSVEAVEFIDRRYGKT